MIDRAPSSTAFVRWPADHQGAQARPAIEQLGGKGNSLAALSATMPVPAWFALTPAAFSASATPELLAALAAGTAGVEALGSLRPSEDVCAELRAALSTLCGEVGYVAVRSSAADEDSAQLSFAGQLESYLFVTPDKVPERVADVWRSAFSERVMAYRREHKVSGAGGAPAVIVQCMIDADVSGVAFSVDPVSAKRDVAVVGALYGLGTALVSGDCDADTYRVDGEGAVVERDIVAKVSAHRAKPGSGDGVFAEPVPEVLAQQPALDDDQIRRVAALARKAQLHFGAPQDIEWAIKGDQLWLLQSRPITSLGGAENEGGLRCLWDNSNIAESYGGVTTPLTFSFARHAYDGAYRQFCRLMRIPEATISAHDEMFSHMLGLIHGRVYYNLLNWYRMLALLPGYSLNRGFMEQMMGVKEGLPQGILATPKPASLSARIRDGLNVAGVTAAFAGHYVALPRRTAAFFLWLHETLGPGRPDYEAARPDELAATYRRLEQRLLNRWDAPLINDLFAMIFFGLLRGLCARWCGDCEGTLQNSLVSGGGEMISAQPAQLVLVMAREAAPHPELVAALCDAPLSEALRAVEQAPRVVQLYHEYLDKFGDRTTDELKLESPTLYDDPLMLLRSVGRLAQRVAQSPGDDTLGAADQTLRREAEQRIAKNLRGNPLRRAIFSWVLRNARERIVARENLRFERTRLFGRVRSIFAELGRKFQRAGILADAGDIFYLEVEEALGFVEGTATCADLGALAALRKTEFERYRSMPAPPDRFETRGMVNHSPLLPAAIAGPGPAPSDAERLTGLGCCPGIVRGQVRVVFDPRNSSLRFGEILVAERTDPGWVMLFPSAAGLLVERGSLLSHSAIVAREMRIPAVVSLSGVMQWLKDGDWVELNGSTGTVVKIAAPAATESSHAQ